MNSVNSAFPASQQHYGTIVGEFDHEVQLGHGTPHARFALDENGNQVEADINVHSDLNPDGSYGGSQVEYAIRNDVVDHLPSEGEQVGGSFSYADQGLTEDQFQKVDTDSFHQQLIGLAQHSQRVALSGMIYQDPGKTGIHDIHMNAGNDNPSRDQVGKDGMVQFYQTENDGKVHRETVYIKFQSQDLQREANEEQANS